MRVVSYRFASSSPTALSYGTGFIYSLPQLLAEHWASHSMTRHGGILGGGSKRGSIVRQETRLSGRRGAERREISKCPNPRPQKGPSRRSKRPLSPACEKNQTR